MITHSNQSGFDLFKNVIVPKHVKRIHRLQSPYFSDKTTDSWSNPEWNISNECSSGLKIAISGTDFSLQNRDHEGGLRCGEQGSGLQSEDSLIFIEKSKLGYHSVNSLFLQMRNRVLLSILRFIICKMGLPVSYGYFKNENRQQM